MSDSIKEDAAASGDTAPASTTADAPAPPPARPASKTMVGIGVPTPPPARGAKPAVPLPPPPITATFAKPAAPPPPPAASGRSSSLFDLDAPNTGRIDVSALRKPAASQPTPAPAQQVVAPQTQAQLPSVPPTAAAVDDAVAALFQPSTSTFDPPLSLAPDGPSDDRNSAASSATPEESLDSAIDFSKSADTLEGRRARLASRYKAARTAVKVLSLLDPTEEERKEVIALFSEYDTRLKSLSAATSEAAKKDSSALHRELDKEGVDELERTMTRAEERMLALDEYVTQAKFYARITKDKHPPKLLLRYARFLASRRFNVGYRRDRFEYLVTELLTIRTSDGRLRLLPRDKAKPVLQQVLSGAPLATQQADREVAVAYLRESLERLSKITTHEEFFESGFFLDVHGYKVSMRDQATSPEFLYLSIALNVEIHNSMEGWIAGIERLQKANQLTQEGRPRDFLGAQLRAQEEAVQSVFGGFRHPKERASQQSAGRVTGATPTKDIKKVAKKPPRKQVTTGSADLAELARTQMTKLVIVTAVILASFAFVLFQTGAVSVGEPALTPVTMSEMQQLSPLLVTGLWTDHKTKLEATLSRPMWNQLSRSQRISAADMLAKNLKTLNVQNADVYAYKELAIRVEQGVVSVIR